MSRSRFVDNGDALIHYLDSEGPDGGAPIVLVPGMTDVADDYAAALPAFGRRTLVVELRGHGRSSAPADGYELDHLSGDVAAVVDDVTDGPVHLATFSRGTPYALGWAVAHPGRVRSISIGDYPPREIVPPPEAIDRLLDGTWRGSSVRSRLNESAARRTFAGARERSFWEPLERLQPPLLVVRAALSRLIGDDEWTRFERVLPHARLLEFDDSPHDLFRQDRTRYPRLVRDHVEAAEEGIG